MSGYCVLADDDCPVTSEWEASTPKAGGISPATPMTFDAIARLPLVRKYEEAFRQVTGVTLKLVPAGPPTEHVCFGAGQSPFCRLITANQQVAGACLAAETEAQRLACQSHSAQSVRCFAGLQVVAAPVVVAGRHVATWMGGQVLPRKPTRASFRAVAAQLAQWGLPGDVARIESAFLATPVVEADRFQAMLQPLNLFAQHLGESADRLWADHQPGEPPNVTQAKAYLHARLGEPIGLAEVAAAAHLSPYHFCRVFRSATGMTFTEYLSRLRVEKAKALLSDSSIRVSEVAFATGFGSISQFNTVFRKVAGQSPSEFRDSLHGP